MSASDIHDFLRPGELVDEAQLQELERWQLLDFRAEPHDAFVSHAPVVVVCGCARSGTTLARVILDSHAELYAGPESLLFLPVPIDVAELAFKFDLDPQRLAALLDESRSRAEFIDAFQSALLGQNGKTTWVDKTARNVHRLDYILEHFPAARILHVIRDPRDVIASLKTHRKWRTGDGQPVPTGYCMPVELCVERWERAMADALAHRGAAYYREVRYESLVRDTERAVREMCDFLGVGYDERMLGFHLAEGPTRDPRKFPQNVEATRPISEASIGRHRRTLTAAEIELVEERLGETMETLGYAASPKPRRRPSLPAAEPTHLHVVSAERVHQVLGDPLRVKHWTREALRVHYAGAFLQPPKSYLITGSNLYDRVISLPASVLGESPTVGMKWIGSHSLNHERGLERAHAVIVLNDPVTNAPRVVMDGTSISSLRTLAISLIALDQFAPRPRSVGILGMGRLGRMHAQLLGDLYPSIERVACFSRRAPFDDLLSDPLVLRCASPKDVLASSEVVITSSAATEPYILEEHLYDDCRLVVNLSLMDCHVDVIANSAHIVVDDWSQNVRADRVFKTGVERGLYGRERVAELGEVLFGPRKAYGGRVFVNPLGMGLEDVYVAGQVARALGVYP